MASPDDRPRVALVVPCYNEASRLDPAAFSRALRAFPFLHLIFVDDGSRDGTAVMLADLTTASAGRVSVLTLKNNSGKAEAVRTGILSAFERSFGWVGYWDADLAAPLEAIDDFLEVGAAKQQVDIILGSRVRLLGRNISREWYRHYFGRVFATFASLTLGIAVYDTQCGAKLFRVSPRIAAIFREPFSSRWAFDVELLGRYLRDAGDRAAAADRGIYELALRRWTHVGGSKLGVIDSIRGTLDLWRVYRRIT